MKHTPLLVAVLISPAVVSVASRAHAGLPPVFVVADRKASDRADELMKQAFAFGDKDRYAEAEPLLREAWSLKRSYDIAANLGIVEAALGKWRDAAEHLTFALKSFPANGKPEHRKLGEQTLTKALAHVTALSIKTSLENAEVLVDGKRVGTSPLGDVVFVEPGVHVVEARLTGYQPAQLRVDAAEGAAQDVVIALVRASEPPALPTPERRPIWPAIVSGIVAAGGVAVGAGLTVAANGKSADADAIGARLGGRSTCAGTPPPAAVQDCQDLKAALRSQSTLTDGARAGFIIGGAALLGAVGLGVWSTLTPRRERSGLQVAPAITTSDVGVIVRGAW